MINGPAPRADGPPSESSTPRSGGPPNEPGTTETPTEYPIELTQLSGMLDQVFREGWALAKALPDREEPPELSFSAIVDQVNRRVEILIQVPD